MCAVIGSGPSVNQEIDAHHPAEDSVCAVDLHFRFIHTLLSPETPTVPSKGSAESVSNTLEKAFGNVRG